LIERYEEDHCWKQQRRIVLIKDVNEGLSYGADTFSLPPFVGSVHLYENLKQEINLLREFAAELFDPVAPVMATHFGNSDRLMIVGGKAVFESLFGGSLASKLELAAVSVQNFF
uniref:Sugar kinase n=1 Tax=Gongylonema pulchrum TaxID=637853 RepID=A0A183D4S9_9BILA